MSLAVAAEQVRQAGRGRDTELVHMTPREVQGIASLAPHMVTTNPETGLQEFGFFEDILPMIVGVASNVLLPGIGPLATAAITGGTSALTTGSLEKGLMSGMLSFGLGSLLGPAGNITKDVPIPGGVDMMSAGPGGDLASVADWGGASDVWGNVAGDIDYANWSGNPVGNLPVFAANNPGTMTGAIENLWNPSTRMDALGAMVNDPNALRNAGIAGIGALGLFGGSDEPKPRGGGWDYQGPYQPDERTVSPHPDPTTAGYVPEHNFFPTQAPGAGNFQVAGEQDFGPPRFQQGGLVGSQTDLMGRMPPENMGAPSHLMGPPEGMEDNPDKIVADAMAALMGRHPEPKMAIQKFIDIFGEDALMALIQRAKQASEQSSKGGLIKGPGDGQSDSIPARIEPTGQQATLSNGEFVVPADAVSGLGGGSTDAGANKLQAVVDAVRRRQAAVAQGA